MLTYDYPFLNISLPFLGVFIYLIAENHGMAERNAVRTRHEQQQFDSYIQNVTTPNSAGGAVAEIEKAQGLLDGVAIRRPHRFLRVLSSPMPPLGSPSHAPAGWC